MLRLRLELSDGARRAVTEADMQMDDLENFTLEELRSTFSFTLKDVVVYRRLANHHKRARETEDRMQPAATPIAAEVHTLKMSGGHATGKVVLLSPVNAAVERLRRYSGSQAQVAAQADLLPTNKIKSELKTEEGIDEQPEHRLPPIEDNEKVIVSVVMPSGGVVKLRIGRNKPVRMIRGVVSRESGMSYNSFRLLFDGSSLHDDHKTLADYNICDNDTIDAIAEVRGG